MSNDPAAERLRSFIERIERLDEEQKAIGADKREVFSEAKGVGFDTKVMRRILVLRKMDDATRQEQEALEDLYRRAVGMEPAGEAPPIDPRLGRAIELFRRNKTVRAVATALGISPATAGRLRQQAEAAGLLVSRLTSDDETETPHDPETGEIIEFSGESREWEKPAEPVCNPEAPLTDEAREGPSGTAAPIQETTDDAEGDADLGGEGDPRAAREGALQGPGAGGVRPDGASGQAGDAGAQSENGTGGARAPVADHGREPAVYLTRSHMYPATAITATEQAALDVPAALRRA